MRAICQSGYGQKILTVLGEDEKPVFFRIQRNNMLNFKEIINGRIVKKNRTLRGYFIETDKKLPVFVPSRFIYTEGENISLQITKEARLGKDATGQILTKQHVPNIPDITYDLPKEIQSVEPDYENLTNSLIEEALETTITFAHGANIHIERTQCCWCIDVDSASSTLSLSEINEAACPLIAKQIKLKNLSGIILIDFAGFKTHTEQKHLFELIKTTLKDDKRSTIYGFTRSNLFEIKRTRTTAALADLFLTPDGYKHPAALAPIIMQKITQCKKGHMTLILHPSLLTYLPQEIYIYCNIQPDPNMPIDFFELKGE